MLKECQYETEVFLKTVSLLGEKLGPLLLQFPPNFAAEHFPDLELYLQKLPKQQRYVVEVRNKSWLTPEFFSILKANKVALAWADGPFAVQISEVTADFLYIRWEGDRKKVNGTLGKIETERKEDLKAEAAKIDSLVNKQVEVFGYFGKYYSGYPPSDIVNLKQYLNNKKQS
jgi:uncharacterized protein YecE (DUF72 family)